MATQLVVYCNSSSSIARTTSFTYHYSKHSSKSLKLSQQTPINCSKTPIARLCLVRCTATPIQNLRTCKNCKTQFDPSLNHARACRFHTSHFGGETKRKFESVHSGGTMNTPDSGKVFQYWHCCGSEDPFDPGCTASPHSSYDD